MVNTSAEAFAPATVANLGVGFDILGLALAEPGDVVRAEFIDGEGARILRIEGDGGRLPLEPDKNTACVAANSLLRQLGTNRGVGLTIRKNLPLASGLGSSAASAVAAVVAVNALLGTPLRHEDLLFACLDGEAAVSGYHADNVGPCLLGGIRLVRPGSAESAVALPVPEHLWLSLVTPDVAVPTAMARSVLPAQVNIRDMVSQTAAVARLVTALYSADLVMLAEAMESDTIVEPARAHLMPHLHDVRAVAHQAGALGLFISGAGPTLCAVCHDDLIACQVASAMRGVYHSHGIASEVRHTRISSRGAYVLDSS